MSTPSTAGPTIHVARRPDDLDPHVAAWEALAAAAVEPNVFYEWWMVLPAWRAFGEGHDIMVVLVYDADGPSPAGPRLDGVFPLERLPGVRGLGGRVLRMWRSLHTFLCTPLVRRGTGGAAIRALFDWLSEDPLGASLLDWSWCTEDGPVRRLLVSEIDDRGSLTFGRENWARALLVRASDPDAALAQAMSTGNRKELRRQRRRLAEQGRLETRRLAAGEDADPWIAQFLALESSGWKGDEGSALAGDPAQQTFFESFARAAHARGRLMMLGLYVDDRPIALKCNLVAAPGAFAFKIAFDEHLARFSPGVQLEIDNVYAFHERQDCQWMDSCASRGHFMIERLWSERRVIGSTLIGTGRAPGNLVVSVLPLLRWFKRTALGRGPVRLRSGE